MKTLMLQIAIAFLTPFATALYKSLAEVAARVVPKIVGKLPKNTIPLFNAGFGAVLEVLAPMLAGVNLPEGSGLLAGMAGGGLRDIVMKGRK